MNGITINGQGLQTLLKELIQIESVNPDLSKKGDVILTFVADEEYKSIGTEAVLKEYTADAAVVCEPTNLRIVTAHKGFSWIKIEVLGRAAHGSLPERGVDAIIKAGKVLTEIENLGSHVLTQKKHPLLGSPSIHASVIRGGIELSTYPDYCTIELERRMLPGEDKTTVTQEMDNILKAIKARDDRFKADFDVWLTRPAYEVSREEPIIQSLSRAYQLILDEAPQFRGMGGWLESALLAEAGIPTVIFGPSGEGAHASVEYVDFDSVMRTTEVLVELIIDFCNG